MFKNEWSNTFIAVILSDNCWETKYFNQPLAIVGASKSLVSQKSLISTIKNQINTQELHGRITTKKPQIWCREGKMEKQGNSSINIYLFIKLIKEFPLPDPKAHKNYWYNTYLFLQKTNMPKRKPLLLLSNRKE